jgi:hypothetical protein
MSLKGGDQEGVEGLSKEEGDAFQRYAWYRGLYKKNGVAWSETGLRKE